MEKIGNDVILYIYQYKSLQRLKTHHSYIIYEQEFRIQPNLNTAISVTSALYLGVTIQLQIHLPTNINLFLKNTV